MSRFFLRTLTLFLAFFIISACETGGSSALYDPIDLEGNPLQENEIMLINSKMLSPFSTCRNMKYWECGHQAREWMAVQMRFDGYNMIYRIGYSAYLSQERAPTQKLNLELPYRYGGASQKYEIPNIDISNARKVTGNSGRKYWLTEWMWDAPTYQNLQLENIDYTVGMHSSALKMHHAFFDLIKRKAKEEGRAFSWNIKLLGGANFVSTPNSKLHSKRRLYGDEALAALANPQQMYEEKILALDNAYKVYLSKRKNASQNNKAYSQFIRKEMYPFTVVGMIKAYQCPALSGIPDIGHNPPKEFYAYGDEAIKRAQCLDKVLNDYSPDRLISHYSAILDEEGSLYSRTFEEKRFSLNEALKEADWAVEAIDVAMKRADELYDGGDKTARIYNEKRQAQQREAAAMRSLYQSLQQTNQALQQQMDQTTANIRAIQKQARHNHWKKSWRYKTQSKQTKSVPSLPKPKNVVSSPRQSDTASRTTASSGPQNCVSHGRQFSKYESICFESGMRQYSCRNDSNGPYWDYVQILSLKSSLDDASLCVAVFPNSTGPSGSPVRE